MKTETVTKHTPGPWKAFGCAVYQEDNWQDGANLGGKYICGIRDTNNPTDERAANARLIAAAPELLDALTKLASAAARIVEDDNKPTLVHMRELNRCRRAACEAIAKAERTK